MWRCVNLCPCLLELGGGVECLGHLAWWGQHGLRAGDQASYPASVPVGAAPPDPARARAPATGAGHWPPRGRRGAPARRPLRVRPPADWSDAPRGRGSGNGGRRRGGTDARRRAAGGAGRGAAGGAPRWGGRRG